MTIQDSTTNSERNKKLPDIGDFRTADGYPLSDFYKVDRDDGYDIYHKDGWLYSEVRHTAAWYRLNRHVISEDS